MDNDLWRLLTDIFLYGEPQPPWIPLRDYLTAECISVAELDNKPMED